MKFENGGLHMKRNLMLVVALLFGITLLAGCAGTGEKFASDAAAYKHAVGPWPAPTIESEGLR
jgi:predicted small secreted protein